MPTPSLVMIHAAAEALRAFALLPDMQVCVCVYVCVCVCVCVCV